MTLDFAATFFASATALLPIFADKILNVGARGYGILRGAGNRSRANRFGDGALGNLRKQEDWLSGPSQSLVWRRWALVCRTLLASLLMLGLTGALDTVSTGAAADHSTIGTPDYLRGRMTSINMVFFWGPAVG